MKKYKSIVGLLCYVIFFESGVFCYESGPAPFSDSETMNPVDKLMTYHLIQNFNTNTDLAARLKRSRQDWMEEFPLACMTELIEDYRQASWLTSLATSNTPKPFTEVLFKKVSVNNKNIEIPYYLKAILKFKYLPISPRPPMPGKITGQMSNMGALSKTSEDGTYDEKGHLLAYSLGGGMTNLWNYVPQLNRLNRHTPEGSHSLWRGEEDSMRTFLINNKSGRIDWNVVVVYDLSNSNNIRPWGFILQYNTTNNQGAQTISKRMNFSNNPDSQCFYEECELPCK